MGIHSMVLPDGVDVDQALRGVDFETDTDRESQDNPTLLDWAEHRREQKRMEALWAQSVRRERGQMARRSGR